MSDSENWFRIKHLHGTSVPDADDMDAKPSDDGDVKKLKEAKKAYWAAHPSGGECPCYMQVSRDGEHGAISLQKCGNSVVEGKGGYATAHVNASRLGKVGKPVTGFVITCADCNNDKAQKAHGGGVQFCVFEAFSEKNFGLHDGRYTEPGKDTELRDPRVSRRVDVVIASSGAAGDWFYKAV